MDDQHAQLIQTALKRVRSRRILFAVVSRGGRLALAFGLITVAAGLVVWQTYAPAWYWMLVFTVAGTGAVILALTWARARAAGQPPEVEALLLDRSAGLSDAVPAYLESQGPFQVMLGRQVAAKLDSAHERNAIPSRSPVPLVVAFLLVLTPLFLMVPKQMPDDPPIVASEQTDETLEQSGAGSPDGNGGEAPEEGSESSSTDAEGQAGNGNAGDEGEAPLPSSPEAPGGAGPAPDDNVPEPSLPQDLPQPGDEGDQPQGTEPPESPVQPELDEDLRRIRPVAGEGETTTVDRTRWIYNPHGAPQPGATPRPPELELGGERAIPRTKLTSRERREISELYRQLFE